MGAIVERTKQEVDILVTREVRWFANGPLPVRLVDWFTDGVAITEERRVDRYDGFSARVGIGLKYRAGETFDAKYLLSHEEELELADGLAGRVGDWLKMSRPIRDPRALAAPLIPVDKHLRTRRYALPGDMAGCDVELAEVSGPEGYAWSLCLETYGERQLRRAALGSGVERFVEETPLPAGVRFEADRSCSYPSWIARHCMTA